MSGDFAPSHGRHGERGGYGPSCMNRASKQHRPCLIAFPIRYAEILFPGLSLATYAQPWLMAQNPRPCSAELQLRDSTRELMSPDFVVLLDLSRHASTRFWNIERSRIQQRDNRKTGSVAP